MDLEGFLCSDGNFCIIGDVCNFVGICILGVDLCDGLDGDGNCAEFCDSVIGLCGGVDLDGLVCGDDGDFCIIEVCVGGVCVFNEVVGCCILDI